VPGRFSISLVLSDSIIPEPFSLDGKDGKNGPHDNGGPRGCQGPNGLENGEGLLQVGEEVLHVFDSDGNPYQAVG
jgi:hypothetical protein